jgi:tRNA(Ile)-lysidine synthase
MARLGPYGAKPRLAVAVSGGADSTALALLARDWAAGQSGDVLALIVDHGLRDGSRAEAELTAARLVARGIAAQVLRLENLAGPALQERARAARYNALAQAALAAGRLHVLLGHHAADQSETVAMRAARGAHGQEGMAAWAARNPVLLLRPLLTVQPAALRAFLRAQAMEWVEDPSNFSPRFERVRLRQAGTSAQPADPAPRQARESETAAYLARHAAIRPEGFALLDAAKAPVSALGALIRALGGAPYAPRQAALAALAENLRPATLGGVRILPAGRLGAGWLLVREPAGMAPPIPALAGAVWDNRFRLAMDAPGQSLGALGTDAKKFKKYNNLPAIVLRTQPCLRGQSGTITFPAGAPFSPPAPATSHLFFT